MLVFPVDLYRPTWPEDKMPTMSENEWRELYLRLGSKTRYESTAGANDSPAIYGSWNDVKENSSVLRDKVVSRIEGNASALLVRLSAESASGGEVAVKPLRGQTTTVASLGLAAAATQRPPARRNLRCSSVGPGIFACCAPIEVPSVNFDQNVCVQLTAHPETASATLDLQLDGLSLVETTLTANNPPPLCVPVPQFPPLTLCVRAYDLGFSAGGVRFCINLEAQLGGVPLLVLRFQCVRVNPGGVSLEPRPPNFPFFSLEFGGASIAYGKKEGTEETKTTRTEEIE